MLGLISPLAIVIIIQIVFEMVPLSSSTVTKIFSSLFFESKLTALNYDQIKIANILSDFIPLIFFRKLLARKFLSAGDFAFFDFYNDGVKYFLLAGFANFFTMLFFFAKEMFIPGSLVTYLPVKLMISSFFIFSLYVKDSLFATVDYQDVGLFTAFFIGIAQGISTLGGVSRFGITYVVARWFNISTNNSMLFSFILHSQISIVYYLRFCYYYGPFNILQGLQWIDLCVIFFSIIFSYFIFWGTHFLAVIKKFYIFSFLYPFLLVVIYKYLL